MLSIINHQSSIINHQSSIINHQSSVIDHRSRSLICIMPYASCVIRHSSFIIHHSSFIIHYSLSFTHQYSPPSSFMKPVIQSFPGITKLIEKKHVVFTYQLWTKCDHPKAVTYLFLMQKHPGFPTKKMRMFTVQYPFATSLWYLFFQHRET